MLHRDTRVTAGFLLGASATAEPIHGLPGRALRLGALLCACVLAGCTTIETQKRDWSDYQGPGARYFAMPDPDVLQLVPDAAEPFNRSMYATNDVFLRWVVAPAGEAWRFIFPPAARRSIGRFGWNLAYPVRALNNLFQGEFAGAGIETGRFLVNSTVGVAGFFDPATPLGISKATNDTTTSLTKAGWDHPGFLTIPVVGATSTRDGTGWVGDTLMHIATYFNPTSYVLWFNEQSGKVESYKHQDDLRYDGYEASRFSWSVMHLPEQEGEGEFEQGPGDEPGEVIDSVLLTYRNPEFGARAELRRVSLPGRDKSLPFNLWLQPDPAPLLYLWPAQSRHRSGDGAVGLAEVCFEQGWSVVTLSGSMTPEFLRGASRWPVTGYAPLDAADLREALASIDADLRAEHGQLLGARVLAGLSTGGFGALLLAADEQPPDDGLHLDGVLAVDPPVDLAAAWERLDGFYRIPLRFPEDQRQRLVNNVFSKIRHLLGGKQLKPGEQLSLVPWQARFLIGVRSRMALASLIFESQWRHDLGVLRTEISPMQRGPAYAEILDYSLMEYLYAFVLPALEARADAGLADEQALRAGLRLESVADGLAARDSLRVITNQDPDLTLAGQRAWLTGLLGPERVSSLPLGTALGNLWRPELQLRIVAALDELAAGR